MDRKRLQTDIKYLKDKKEKHLDNKKKEQILKDSITLMGDGSGRENLLIVVEELAELQQEIIKYLRDGENSIGLREEFVDVSLGMDYIKTILLTNKEDEELIKYIEDIKYLRQQNRNDKMKNKLREESKKKK